MNLRENQDHAASQNCQQDGEWPVARAEQKIDPEYWSPDRKSDSGITSVRSLRFAYWSVLPPDSGLPFQALRG
jgi:hypothetical protein